MLRKAERQKSSSHPGAKLDVNKAHLNNGSVLLTLIAIRKVSIVEIPVVQIVLLF